MPIQSFLRFFSVWVHRSYDVAVYRRCATSKKSVLRNIGVLYFFSWQFTWCTLDVLSSRRLPHCSAIPLQWFHSSASCKRPDEMFKVSHSTSHWRIQGRGPGTLGNPLFLPPPPPPQSLVFFNASRYDNLLEKNSPYFFSQWTMNTSDQSWPGCQMHLVPASCVRGFKHWLVSLAEFVGTVLWHSIRRAPL